MPANRSARDQSSASASDQARPCKNSSYMKIIGMPGAARTRAAPRGDRAREPLRVALAVVRPDDDIAHAMQESGRPLGAKTQAAEAHRPGSRGVIVHNPRR